MLKRATLARIGKFTPPRIINCNTLYCNCRRHAGQFAGPSGADRRGYGQRR